jgi:hypothetical protein
MAGVKPKKRAGTRTETRVHEYGAGAKHDKGVGAIFAHQRRLLRINKRSPKAESEISNDD